jgi:hypothetical protein
MLALICIRQQPKFVLIDLCPRKTRGSAPVALDCGVTRSQWARAWRDAARAASLLLLIISVELRHGACAWRRWPK